MMHFSFKSKSTATVAVAALTTASLMLAGCDHATPSQAMASVPVRPAAVAQGQWQAPAQTEAATMQTGMEAIKACKANGLEEATCTQVYRDMMAGRPPQGAATLADCEAKHGAGQCGNNPIPNASGTGSVFLPLVAGAALGALGGYLLSKNLAPKGAYTPPTNWLKNQPSISAAQNPVAGTAKGGSGASTSAYAQTPGNYKVGNAKVAGVSSTAVNQFTPPTGSSKASAAPSPATQSGAASNQGAARNPYAVSGGNSSKYGGSSGGYTYRPPQTSRPGARSLGQRR